MKYRKGYKYQLAENEFLMVPISPDQDIVTEFINLSTKGELNIRSGYAYDGPSGPTWPTDNTMVPSAVHDVLAQLLRQGLLSQGQLAGVNELFNQMLKDRGMFWFRRWYWLKGLWLTGGSFADPSNIKEVFEVS